MTPTVSAAIAAAVVSLVPIDIPAARPATIRAPVSPHSRQRCELSSTAAAASNSAIVAMSLAAFPDSRGTIALVSSTAATARSVSGATP
jgi:hypothetical protein